MDNSKLINQINQLFHNKGVKQEERFNLLIDLLENKSQLSLQIYTMLSENYTTVI